MSDSAKNPLRRAFEIVITLAPWVISMYVLYWLDYGQVWDSGTAHRGKIAVTILVIGMGLSFLIYSRFASRKPK